MSQNQPLKSQLLGYFFQVVLLKCLQKLFSSHCGIKIYPKRPNNTIFVTIDGRNELDNVELYNTKSEIWETSDFKLSKGRYDFSFLTVKLGDILSNLQ